MTSCNVESFGAVTTLPGLDHLRDKVTDWDAAVRTLALTATAVAESAGVGAAAGASLWQSKESLSHDSSSAASSQVAKQQQHASSPSLPTLVIPAGQLKPGRVFVVANLQGAYYTLMELLSRHRFDFRCDNLLHLGNLVARMPPAPAASAAACGCNGGNQEVLLPQPPQADPSRRVRNSPSVLKLVRRHGGLGPMGSHECLALLTAARRNRLSAQQQSEEEQRLLAAAAPAAGVKASPRGPCSALSLQLAAAMAPAYAAARSFIPNSVAAASTSIHRSSWLCTDGSDSASSDDDESDDETDVMVAAPLTPHRDERIPHGAVIATSIANSTAGGLTFDDVDLAQLLSMPAVVVLEAYGIGLQHAGPVDGSDATAGARRYHALYSHRRCGGDAAGGRALSTGLASCRDVVRCAVLPPLQMLQRRSPGFGAKMAAAMAPSREELLLEVMEEPLSELDL